MDFKYPEKDSPGRSGKRGLIVTRFKTGAMSYGSISQGSP